MNRGDSKGEQVLLENKWVRRLGRLHQNQGTFAAYPGAVHTRFQHSLGVMHLAGKFVEACYPRFYKAHKGKHEKGALRKPEYVIQVTRIAGLLHDICHGPFSHLFDREVLKERNNLNHEKLSKILIEGELRPFIEGIRISWEGNELESQIRAKDVNDILHPFEDDDPNKEQRADLEFWEKPVAKVFHGVYSADNLDYLLRDSHYAGTPEYGTVDAERLIHRSVFHEGGIAIEKKSLSTFRSFLLSRMFMYQNVYYHRTVRAFEISLSEILKDVADIMGLFSKEENIDWNVFYPLDDNFVLSLGYHWSNTPDSDSLAERKRNVAERILELTSKDGLLPLIQAHAENEEIKTYPLSKAKELNKSSLQPKFAQPSLKAELEKRGRGNIFKHIRFDYPTTYILKGDPADTEDVIGVYTDDGYFDQTSVSKELEGIPSKVVGVGIYCPPEYEKDVKAACRSLWEGENVRDKGYGDTAT